MNKAKSKVYVVPDLFGSIQVGYLNGRTSPNTWEVNLSRPSGFSIIADAYTIFGTKIEAQEAQLSWILDDKGKILRSISDLQKDVSRLNRKEKELRKSIERNKK